jgi:hypothetical protein
MARSLAIVVLFSAASLALAASHKHSVRADFDGDGRIDEARLIEKQGYVSVVVARAGSPKPQILQFGVNAGASGSICSLPAKLSIEPHDCDTEEGPLPGCEPNARATNLVLTGGDCDAIRMYWSIHDKKLAWWSR